MFGKIHHVKTSSSSSKFICLHQCPRSKDKTHDQCVSCTSANVQYVWSRQVHCSRPGDVRRPVLQEVLLVVPTVSLPRSGARFTDVGVVLKMGLFESHREYLQDFFRSSPKWLFFFFRENDEKPSSLVAHFSNKPIWNSTFGSLRSTSGGSFFLLFQDWRFWLRLGPWSAWEYDRFMCLKMGINHGTMVYHNFSWENSL